MVPEVTQWWPVRLHFNNIHSFTCYYVSILIIYFYVDKLNSRNACRSFCSEFVKLFTTLLVIAVFALTVETLARASSTASVSI